MKTEQFFDLNASYPKQKKKSPGPMTNDLQKYSIVKKSSEYFLTGGHAESNLWS